MENITEIAVRISEEMAQPLIVSSLHGEKFVSESLNRKMSGVFDAGIVSGFVPELTGGMFINVTSRGAKKAIGAALVDNSELTAVTIRQLSDVNLLIPAGAVSIVVMEAVYGRVKTKQVDVNSNVDAAVIKIVSVKKDNQVEICRLDVPAGTEELTPDMLDLSHRDISSANPGIADNLDDDGYKLVNLDFLNSLIATGELGGGSGSFYVPEVIEITQETNFVEYQLDYPVGLLFINPDFQNNNKSYTVDEKTKRVTFKDFTLEPGDTVTLFHEVVKSNPNAKATQVIMWPYNYGNPVEAGLSEFYVPFKAAAISMINMEGAINVVGVNFDYFPDEQLIRLKNQKTYGGERIIIHSEFKAIDGILPDAIQGFSFEKGATLYSVNDHVYDNESEDWYFWKGNYPKKVEVGERPSNDNWAVVGGGEVSYLQLREYKGGKNKLSVYGRDNLSGGGSGDFVLDVTDTTSKDDDGTILIDSLGRRWKRLYEDSKKSEWFGVKEGIDVSSFLQNMLETGGGGIRIKDGQYSVTKKIAVDHSSPDFPVMGKKSKRFDLSGESMTNTTFNTDGNDFLEIKGSPNGAGQGVHDATKIGDFTVYGTNNTGVGLRLLSMAYTEVHDVYAVRNNIGVRANGVLSSDFKRINAQYNNYGMYITRGDNSTANALTISGGHYSGNDISGIEGSVGTRVTLDNVNFEGNGRYAEDSRNTRGLYLRAEEPMSIININGGYFEANEGIADIQIDNLTSSPLIVNVIGVVLVRGNPDGGYCQFVIRPTSPGGGMIILNLLGVHFFTQTAFGYIPDPSRPFIAPLPGLLRVNGADTCHFSEKISLDPSIFGATSVIGGTVTAAGVPSCPDYISVTKTATGVYTLISSVPFGLSGIDWSIFAQSKAGNTRIVHAITLNHLSAEIRTSDGAGTTMDAPFSFIITRQKGI